MRIAWLALIALLAGQLYAGDVAVFQNLGFSEDGRYFQFGQFGIDSESQAPYAQIFSVDVPRNIFVANGNFRLSIPGGASLGDDGRKALLALMDQASALRRRLRIEAVRLGRPIFFRVNGEAGEGKNVVFIDYQTSREYSLQLNQTVSGSGENARSSFSINVTVKTEDGRTLHSLRMGTPSVQRRGITDYRINQVILGPTERELVVIVERVEANGAEPNIRYMAETARLSP